LATVASDAGLRARLAGAARQTVETRYSFAVRMQKMRAVYDELLGRAPMKARDDGIGRDSPGGSLCRSAS